MRKKFSELSKQELANNPNSYVLLGDISVGMFMDKDDNLPDRVFNMGIAEQAMVGFAGGLSTAGGNVIYMDGHLEYIEYPGKFPMTETMARLLDERPREPIPHCE